jgi:hypothetical protein
MNDKNVSKVSTEYYCIDCNYNTLYKCNYNKHLLTAKHKMMTNDDKKVSKVFKCECEKNTNIDKDYLIIKKNVISK